MSVALTGVLLLLGWIVTLPCAALIAALGAWVLR
jgi:phosphate/sulfate permease